MVEIELAYPYKELIYGLYESMPMSKKKDFNLQGYYTWNPIRQLWNVDSCLHDISLVMKKNGRILAFFQFSRTIPNMQYVDNSVMIIFEDTLTVIKNLKYLLKALYEDHGVKYITMRCNSCSPTDMLWSSLESDLERQKKILFFKEEEYKILSCIGELEGASFKDGRSWSQTIYQVCL